MLLKALGSLVKRAAVAVIVLGAGLAYQYTQLSARVADQRIILERRMDTLESHLLEDNDEKLKNLSQSIENRTEQLHSYTSERFDRVDHKLEDIDSRHSRQLESLEANTREALSLSRANERRLIHLLSAIKQPDVGIM